MDKTLRCKDCGKTFVFSEKEQDFFQKLFDDGKIKILVTPKRCFDCRKIKKEKQSFL